MMKDVHASILGYRVAVTLAAIRVGGVEDLTKSYTIWAT